VWICPLLAAVVSGVYAREYLQQRGPLITLQLSSVQGLKAGDTPVLHRGVPIGQIDDIELSPDQKKAWVHVRLRRHEEAFTETGATFWIVRPEFSGTTFQGLGALFSGPYIDSTPGSGERKKEFLGLEKPPVVFGEGLEFVVHAPST
jgi:paraquat-inducible protein B